MALARRLKESSPESDFERANQLSWELAMWLPDNIYKQMTTAISKPNQDVNELSQAVSYAFSFFWLDGFAVQPQRHNARRASSRRSHSASLRGQ
jgi:hypothetical protein